MKFETYCENQSCKECTLDKIHGACEDNYKNMIDGVIPNQLKAYDFYIAAPFFNPDQLVRVELVKEMLKNKGLTFFSPKDDCKCANINDPGERERVFKEDHTAIDLSRGIIAITDGKDPGTIWEAGYAYAKGIPIIYVAFTLGKDGVFNLMLAESGVAACRTVDELRDAIDGREINFKGIVE